MSQAEQTPLHNLYASYTAHDELDDVWMRAESRIVNGKKKMEVLRYRLMERRAGGVDQANQEWLVVDARDAFVRRREEKSKNGIKGNE